MKHKSIFLTFILISLFLVGCASTIINKEDVPVGTPSPPPPAKPGALAGQGYSAGIYDHEYQIYKNFYAYGSVTSYLL